MSPVAGGWVTGVARQCGSALATPALGQPASRSRFCPPLRPSHTLAMPTDEGEGRRGVIAWGARWWRALLAELLATALLVLLGVAALLPPHAPLSHPALAFGFIVVANIEAFGAASGAHMNPAVTLAAALDRRLPAGAALAYAAAQTLGATLGFGALMALAPDAFPAGAVVGGTAPAAVGVLAAAVIEALLTAALALLACGIWHAEDEGRKDPTASIKFGLTVAGLIYAGGAMTGGSLNPARSFAPALLQGFTSDHWVYWVGPLGGSAAATLLHRHALRPPRARPAAAAPAAPAETLPLHKFDH